MASVTSSPVGERVVFRCDGDAQIGAGHVARCVSLATAFTRLGWTTSFIGEYEGLARRLLARADIEVQAPEHTALCGVPMDRCEMAVLDSYSIAPRSICELSRTLPVITLAEANRCPTSGMLLDYHLDRTEPSNPRLLAGPTFAPLDPAFAGAGRAGAEIRRVLVSTGGSTAGHELLTQIAPMVSSVYPDAEMVSVGDFQSETISVGVSPFVELPWACSLADVVADIDLAITAAGLTAYELACAGIPQVTIAIAANQRRVLNGLSTSGLALCLDLTGGDSLTKLRGLLERLRDPGLRRGMAERGRVTFDGGGAQRAAVALTERYHAGLSREG
jgi:spore coat polysaccharide biosynthesis predicted glycosyltransferase SpsG